MRVREGMRRGIYVTAEISDPPARGGEDPHGLGRDTGDMWAERLHEGMTTPPALPAN